MRRLLLLSFALSLCAAPAWATYIPSITALTGDCAASGSGSAAIVCTKTNGANLGSMATQSAGAVAVTGGALTGTAVTIPSTTVATLPACNSGTAGRLGFVTDALLPAALAAVSGGGSVPTLVVCNGTIWIVG